MTRRRDNNKPRKSQVCLFPGYISFCARKGTERAVFATNRIVNLVAVRNQSRFTRQLEQIYHTFELGVALEPVAAAAFTPGETVQVVAGPMKGLRGTIQRIASVHKLVLAVEILGSAAVTVDAAAIQPLPAPADCDDA